MKDDVSLMAHLNHMESLVTQLGALQAPVGEDDQVAVLLSSIEEIPKYKKIIPDRKSTRLNSSHSGESRMPSSA